MLQTPKKFEAKFIRNSAVEGSFIKTKYSYNRGADKNNMRELNVDNLNMSQMRYYSASPSSRFNDQSSESSIDHSQQVQSSSYRNRLRDEEDQCIGVEEKLSRLRF